MDQRRCTLFHHEKCFLALRKLPFILAKTMNTSKGVPKEIYICLLKKIVRGWDLQYMRDVHLSVYPEELYWRWDGWVVVWWNRFNSLGWITPTWVLHTTYATNFQTGKLIHTWTKSLLTHHYCYNGQFDINATKKKVPNIKG